MHKKPKSQKRITIRVKVAPKRVQKDMADFFD
jgi:hypothetical protein